VISADDKASTGDLADRLARLERLIATLASSGSSGSSLTAGGPASIVIESSFTSFPQNNSGHSSHDPDVLEHSVVQNAKAVTSSGHDFVHPAAHLNASIFGLSPFKETTLSHEQDPVSAQLYAQLPHDSTSSILISNGPSMFLGPHGAVSHTRHIRPTDHPALIARRLMMLALCLQQLPSSFDMSSLVFQDNASAKDSAAIIRSWVDSVSSIVTSNDSLVSNAEGVETLILQAIVQGDSGQLRKAWMIGRKAICIAMLLGMHLDHPPEATFNSSCIPGEVIPLQIIESLWFRANCIDRYASLILGLPPTSTDTSFASERRTRDNTPEDRLGKAYAVCAGRISERNDRLASGQDAQALTHTIELELESVAHLMDNAWWHSPGLRAAGSGLSAELMVMNLQVRHYVLTVLLQLPYTLQRDETQQHPGSHEHSRSTCMHACRAVVHRFLCFRRVYKSIATGRQIDYAALLSSMTLLQGHLVRQQAPGLDHHGEESLQPADIELVDSARRMMQDIAACNTGDSLSSEAAKSLQELLDYLQDDKERNEYAIEVFPEAVDGVGWHESMLDIPSPQRQFFTELGSNFVFPVEQF
jgi:hypothetical protein